MMRGPRSAGAAVASWKNQSVHVFEIKAQHTARSVDLKEMLVAMADSKTRGFERANAPVREVCEEGDSVVDIPPGGEGVSHCREISERTV